MVLLKDHLKMEWLMAVKKTASFKKVLRSGSQWACELLKSTLIVDCAGAFESRAVVK